MQSSSSNEAYLQRGYTRERRLSSSGSDIQKKTTPVNTPGSESRSLTETLLQQHPYFNMNPMLNEAKQMQAALAAATAQMKYFSLLRKNAADPQSNVNLSNRHASELYNGNIAPIQSVDMQKSQANFPSGQSSSSDEEKHSHFDKIGNPLAESSNKGKLQQAADANNFDPRSYRAAAGLQPSAMPHTQCHSDEHTPDSRVITSQASYPARPSHLGSSFVPQTQFLSVNVSHGTPGSDKESNTSSTSPHQSSPFGRHGSRSPSPQADRNKQKGENTCTQCGKHFSSSSALAKHKLIHSDERKYVCHICSRGFKRQDHLNGHMITHRDKKPYECHFPECHKSYCDMRSLKRHLENNHSSPLGGTTPGGYASEMSAMYPGFPVSKPSEMTIHRPYLNDAPSSKSSAHVEPVRPSSAPLVPPEPCRVTRNRRSSSGEEAHVPLDPYFLQEFEMRKKSLLVEQEIAKYPRHAADGRHTPPPNSSFSTPYPSPSTSITTSVFGRGNTYMKHTNHYTQRNYNDFFSHSSSHAPHRDTNHMFKPEQASRHQGTVKDKLDYPSIPTLYPPPTLPPGMLPHLNPRFPWHPRYPSSAQSPSSSTMPCLINIHKPLRGFSPHSMYPSDVPTVPRSDASMPVKSEHDAREQAVNTYLQMWASGHRGSVTPEQLFMHSQAGFSPGQKIHTPTDPTAIAVAAAKEQSEMRHSYSNSRESYFAIQPTNAQWQPMLKVDPEVHEKAYQHGRYFHNSSVSPSKERHTNNHESLQYYSVQKERNIIDKSYKPSQENHRDQYRYNKSPPAPYPSTKFEPKERPCTLDTQLHSYDSSGTQLSSTGNYTPQAEVVKKVFENSILQVETADNVIVSPMSPNKKRPRPGPILIPPSMNNRMPVPNSPSTNFQTMAKAVYTPPAMLSPRSVFFNPPLVVKPIAPSTPARYLLTNRRSTSIDQREASTSVNFVPSEDHPKSEVLEPKINIGYEFQAVLPYLMDRSSAQKDIHRAGLMWAPLKADQAKNDEVDAYLDMACSFGLYGGSNNKEYALHILQRTRGNVKEAVRLLLSRRHILRADDPNADYHYSGSVRWTAKERLTFRQAYRTKGKVFSAIQKEVGTKSVYLCVEFYYLWKAMHPESFRARTRMVEVESEQDDEEVPPTPTAPVAPLSTLREPVFECDYPECRARFVSRQALNGHIRVHGGSFSKPADARRLKTKPPVHIFPSDGITPSTSPKKKRTNPTSVIVTNTSDGPQLQFQCKVCGRVFSKVKSRSAHMKTHVKRDENNKPIKQVKTPHPVNPLTIYAT